MKRAFAGAFVFCALLALPVMAQRSMSAGHRSGGQSIAGHSFAGRGFSGGSVFVGGAAGRGFGPQTGVFVGHPHGGIVIRTGPSPGGRFHHGHFHPFFPNSRCFQSPSLCRGAFGFNPHFNGGWYGYWSGYGLPYAGYGLPYAGFPYAATYPDTYSEQVQAALAQQQQVIADLEEQLRREQLNRMQADAAQPAPPPDSTPAPRSDTTEPLTPTILVFRDRQRMEVRNYAIVGETLYEFAPQWTRKILLSDLDLPATVQVNEQRGVRFHVPSSRAQVITRP